MFIRQVKKQRSKEAKIFYQYTLNQSVRINGKVKQQIILYLGSDTLLADKTNRKLVAELLKKKIFGIEDGTPLFELPKIDQRLEALAEKYYQKYLIKYDIKPGDVNDRFRTPPLPPPANKAHYESVEVDNFESVDVKTCGGELLVNHAMSSLGLQEFLQQNHWSENDSQLALISIGSRALFAASEYRTCQYLQDNSSMLEWYDAHRHVNHKQLYRIADKLYQSKTDLDTFIYQKTTDLFNLKDSLVIFDISNTYFESRKQGSLLAQYGRSKEKRNDCKLVVFTGVINAAGFIRHSRIYQGNKPDSDTLEDMLKDLNAHSPKTTNKTVVIDAGIATKENLDVIVQAGCEYVCVSRNVPDGVKQVSPDATVKQLVNRDKQELELKILDYNKEDQENEKHPKRWMYVKSKGKQAKEQSMENKLEKRFTDQLTKIHQSIQKPRGVKAYDKVLIRIGRVIEKYPSIAKQYDIKVLQQQTPTQSNNENKAKVKAKPLQATGVEWTRKQKNDKHGVYYIQTNKTNVDEHALWAIYNTIREVEATFRCLKSQLNIRPVHHQLDHRIESHIYLTILAYQIVNMIKHQLKTNKIYYNWSNVVRIMNTHTLQTYCLPTKTKTIYIRKPNRPNEKVKQIYHSCGCTDIQKLIYKKVVSH